MKLRPPTSQFLEMEAAKEWGYKLSDWQQESVVNRAKCMSHYLHKLIREGYIAEKTRPKSADTKNKGGNLKSLMGAMGMKF